MQQLETQLKLDINSQSKQCSFQPISWNCLFHKICSQNPNEKEFIHLFKGNNCENISETIVIATLECKDFVLSHPNTQRILIKTFDDVKHYEDFITAENRTVFLIVSDPNIPSFSRLQALYMWSKSCATSVSSSYNPRMRGVFTEANHLLERLVDDICFYRQAKLHFFSFSIFQSIDMSHLILPQLNEQENHFLSIYFLSPPFYLKCLKC
jgi:hypothetical protein